MVGVQSDVVRMMSLFALSQLLQRADMQRKYHDPCSSISMSTNVLYKVYGYVLSVESQNDKRPDYHTVTRHAPIHALMKAFYSMKLDCLMLVRVCIHALH